ncbi:MAG: TRAP transporter large permease [Rhodospirillales bacterium]
MGPLEISLASIIVIIVLIYSGLYIAVALGLVSFVGVWIMRGNIDLPVNLLALAAADTVSHEVFAAVPLFALMGLFVSRAGIGADIYRVANFVFFHIRGGLGIATVAANAVFASITGSSIASASVFTRVSVPEMRRFNYGTRFSLGVVAGSSVLGMLIPPSVMMIIYGIVTEQSIGHLFIAGIIPGLVLAAAYSVAIVGMAYAFPQFVGGRREAAADGGDGWARLSAWDVAVNLFPVGLLVVVVLGGIYGGIVTPTEAGAAGAALALLIALARRRLDWRGFWECLVETGYITSTILFLIIAASIYSRMLGIAGLPTMFGAWLEGLDLDLVTVMVFYVILLIILGTIIDTASIILVVVPLFMPALEPFNINLIWFGVVTVIGAEIGLLTPPFGISCFVIKSTLDDPSIKLGDIFYGALPFAAIMLAVLILIIAYPQLSLALL